MQKLLIATNNPGKLLEIAGILKGLPLALVTPAEAGIDLEVDETGATYEANARLKAAAFMEAARLPALADDTGLEVDALDGAPGLHSKRYAPAPDATDADRRRLLLDNLKGFPRPWTARFRCSVALALPGGQVHTADGACEGEIIPAERGAQGFGYDRIFLVRGCGLTMAELDMAQKNCISHRARAVMNILPVIHSYLAEM